MNTIRLGSSALLGVVLLQHATGQVPHVVSYQGRLTAHGTNFDGTGFLKFALVSGATNAASQATASATLVYGFVVQITVSGSGSGYTAPPAVTIADPTGSGALAVAQVSGGQVTGITVLDAGSGYTAPVVNIAPPTAAYGVTTFWSNDGTSGAGGEPAQPVPVHVEQGLFTVLLGDTTLSNMVPIPPAVFAHADVRLRIWFSDDAGAFAFQQLGPDQRIAAVGYAMVATSVPDGSITVGKLADASITTAKLALAARQELSTPAGGIVLSDDPNSTNLLGAGFTRMPVGRLASEEWEQFSPKNPIPNSAQGRSCVWAGGELIVWGGYDSTETSVNTGARYSPASNTWSPTTTSDAPLGREAHSAFWTGRELLVWGGMHRSRGSPTNLGSGGRYDPARDSWASMSLSNVPSPRFDHSTVWTGTEMIVWGGSLWTPTGNQYLNTGGRYDAASDTWNPISSAGAPPAQARAFAAWTGSEMIVWGHNPWGGGGIYDPNSDRWRSLSTAGAPSGPQTVEVWIGTGLLVWNPSDGNGARYDLSTDSWIPIAPGRASLYLPVWTGSEVIAFQSQAPSEGGGRYDPQRDRWVMTIPLHAYC